MTSFRDLKVWSLGIEISLTVYRLTQGFPREELYGLTSQLRRCAVSIPSNVAEGYGRDGTKELLRFLSIARGSLAELETQVHIATELGYVSKPATLELAGMLDEESRMLAGLQRSLRRRLANE